MVDCVNCRWKPHEAHSRVSGCVGKGHYVKVKKHWVRFTGSNAQFSEGLVGEDTPQQKRPDDKAMYSALQRFKVYSARYNRYVTWISIWCGFYIVVTTTLSCQDCLWFWRIVIISFNSRFKAFKLHQSSLFAPIATSLKLTLDNVVELEEIQRFGGLQPGTDRHNGEDTLTFNAPNCHFVKLQCCIFHKKLRLKPLDKMLCYLYLHYGQQTLLEQRSRSYNAIWRCK